ncbi:MAG: hypothetical protein ABR561_08435 [Guyparkeria sp.]
MRPAHLVIASTFALLLTPTVGADEPWKQPGWEPITEEERQPASPDEIAQSAVDVQDYQGVGYVTGGLGADERAWLKQHGHSYPVTLQFSKGERAAFVSSVEVVIRSRNGQTQLEATTDGPLIYIDMPNGNYEVTAKYRDQEQTFDLRVPANAQTSHSINFP